MSEWCYNEAQVANFWLFRWDTVSISCICLKYPGDNLACWETCLYVQLQLPSVFDVLVSPKNNTKLQKKLRMDKCGNTQQIDSWTCAKKVCDYWIMSFQGSHNLNLWSNFCSLYGLNLHSIFLEKCLFGNTPFLCRSSINCKSVFMCQMLLERFLWAGIGLVVLEKI